MLRLTAFAGVSRKGYRERKVKKFFIKNIAADTRRPTQTDIWKRNTAYMRKICRKKSKSDYYIYRLIS